MSALGRVVRGGIRRRRVQVVVIALTVAMAVTAAVLGGSLLVASRAPFETAFAAQRGAHLTAWFDAATVGPDRLSATGSAGGVTAAAGPFPTASLAATLDGNTLPPMALVGRATPDGDVDAVTLTEGSWASGPGEIVLSADGPRLRLGTRLTAPGLSGSPTLTVVGFARSVSRTADAWVVPDQIGTPAGYQMLYRFAAAGTAGEVSAGGTAVTAGLPDGALTGTQSWLTVREEAVRMIELFVPFLTAFGVLGLVMSVLVVGNVVAGAVGAAVRRIGVLKAVGFTPGQVVRAYVWQALGPALAGVVVGVVAAHLLAVPVLAQAEEVYATTPLAVTPWVDAAAVAGALGVVALTAWLAALRAGRLRTVDALAVGRTPRSGRGRWATRLAARLPLPRPVGLGLARPFARPARALAMVAAVAFGAAAVTFTVGLSASLRQVQVTRDHGGDVVVDARAAGSPGEPGPAGKPGEPGQGPGGNRGPGGPGRGPLDADPAAVAAALDAQPGTAAYHGLAETDAKVAGLTGSASVLVVTGDAAPFFHLVTGRWCDAPGEAVVPTPFLTATGTRIGDTVTLETARGAVPLRIVGEVFDTHDEGREIVTPAAATGPLALQPEEYQVAVREGTDPAAYATDLTAAVTALGLTARPGEPDELEATLAINALTTMLTLLLVVVAGLGVLNAVVLDTRDRVRELGIHKALGMLPRQTVTMVLASVVVVGLAGGAAGTPLGTALHALVVPAMGDAVGLNLPPAVLDVYQPLALVPLTLCGLVIAAAGAALPAGWAARTRVVTALRTE